MKKGRGAVVKTKEHSADIKGSPTEVLAECKGDTDGVCHDWHSAKREDGASEIGLGDVERNSDQGHSAKRKGWVTEAVAESVEETEKACDEGQRRKRKNRMADVDVGEEDEGANTNDEVLPLTKKSKFEDDGKARGATAVGGESSALADDHKKAS